MDTSNGLGMDRSAALNSIDIKPDISQLHVATSSTHSTPYNPTSGLQPPPPPPASTVGGFSSQNMTSGGFTTVGNPNVEFSSPSSTSAGFSPPTTAHAAPIPGYYNLGAGPLPVTTQVSPTHLPTPPGGPPLQSPTLHSPSSMSPGGLQGLGSLQVRCLLGILINIVIQWSLS